MTDYETKDSGQHAQYDSGMRRDTEDGKPRFDLIRTKRQPYEEQMIYRYAMLLARGAAKYDARNWEDGDSEVELDRAKSSLLRHAEQLVAGETDEDHAAAVWFNTQAIEYFRWRIEVKKDRIRRKKRKAKGKWQGKRGAENLRRANRLEEKRLAALNASQIRNEVVRRTAELRRRERILSAAKELDAELTQDAQDLKLEVEAQQAELDHTFTFGKGDAEGELTVSADGVDMDTVVASYDGSRRGAVGLLQFVDGSWADTLQKTQPHTIPHRHVAGRPWPTPVSNFTMAADGEVIDNRTGRTVIPGVSIEEDLDIRNALQTGLDRDQRSR